MSTTEVEQGIRYTPPNVRSWRDEGRFLIPGVSYRGNRIDCLLFEEMTPPMSQDNLIEFYEREKQAGNPLPTDAPLIWAIATRAYELRDENSEEGGRLQSFFRKDIRRYPNTLTRIHYSPGDDSILHNVGTSEEYTSKGRVVGPDNWVDNIPDKDILERVLGTQDVEQINAVSQHINGTNAYIRRLNSKPKQLDKRVARFSAYDDRLVLGCGRGALGGYPAFRVLKIE